MERKIKRLDVYQFDFCHQVQIILENYNDDRRIIDLINIKYFLKRFTPNEHNLSPWASVAHWITSQIIVPKIEYEFTPDNFESIWCSVFKTVKNIPEPVRAEYLLDILEFEFDNRIRNEK